MAIPNRISLLLRAQAISFLVPASHLPLCNDSSTTQQVGLLLCYMGAEIAERLMGCGFQGRCSCRSAEPKQRNPGPLDGPSTAMWFLGRCFLLSPAGSLPPLHPSGESRYCLIPANTNPARRSDSSLWKVDIIVGYFWLPVPSFSAWNTRSGLNPFSSPLYPPPSGYFISNKLLGG